MEALAAALCDAAEAGDVSRLTGQILPHAQRSVLFECVVAPTPPPPQWLLEKAPERGATVRWGRWRGIETPDSKVDGCKYPGFHAAVRVATARAIRNQHEPFLVALATWLGATMLDPPATGVVETYQLGSFELFSVRHSMMWPEEIAAKWVEAKRDALRRWYRFTWIEGMRSRGTWAITAFRRYKDIVEHIDPASWLHAAIAATYDGAHELAAQFVDESRMASHRIRNPELDAQRAAAEAKLVSVLETCGEGGGGVVERAQVDVERRARPSLSVAEYTALLDAVLEPFALERDSRHTVFGDGTEAGRRARAARLWPDRVRLWPDAERPSKAAFLAALRLVLDQIPPGIAVARVAHWARFVYRVPRALFRAVAKELARALGPRGAVEPLTILLRTLTEDTSFEHAPLARQCTLAPPATLHDEHEVAATMLQLGGEPRGADKSRCPFEALVAFVLSQCDREGARRLRALPSLLRAITLYHPHMLAAHLDRIDPGTAASYTCTAALSTCFTDPAGWTPTVAVLRRAPRRWHSDDEPPSRKRTCIDEAILRARRDAVRCYATSREHVSAIEWYALAVEVILENPPDDDLHQDLATRAREGFGLRMPPSPWKKPASE